MRPEGSVEGATLAEEDVVVVAEEFLGFHRLADGAPDDGVAVVGRKFFQRGEDWLHTRRRLPLLRS